MAADSLRAAVVGLGWWSDVLADAAGRSGRIELVACYTRTEEKRRAFAARYDCRPVESYDEILRDRSIEAVLNTTPNNAHLETTRLAAQAGKHVFLDKPIANTVADGRDITDLCAKAGIPCWVGGMLESATGAAICTALAMLDNFTYPADIFPSSRFYREDLSSRPVELIALSDGTPGVAAFEDIPAPSSRLEAMCVARAAFG